MLLNTLLLSLDHCLELTKLWHQMRSNLDGRLLVATNDKKVAEGRRGKNHKNIFIGHCDGEGSKNYRPLQGIGASLKKIPALYSTAENEEGKEKKAANKEETEKDVKGDKKEAKDTKPSSKLTFPAIPRRDDAPPSATIAYAIPVTTCDPKDSTFLDKVSVLRHSVHQNSIRTPSSASKYDYRMYAIVHKDAEKCRPTLEEAGFVVTVPTSPVDIKAMKKAKNYLAEELTDAIAKDYIQVYAYDLPTPKEVSEPEPIAVLLELDVILFKPLDDLFDAMLLDQKKGKAARNSIPLERPKDKLPNQIDAFFTRWYAHRAPDSDLPAQVQRGFLVVRRNKDAIKDLIDGGVNKKNKFVKGRNEQKHGWGGVGYTEPSLGGLLGYYYDKFKAGTAVELNSCRFNHVGMDNLYRAPPNFNSGFLRKHVGKCRSGQKECEDCTTTDVDSIYVARYHDEQCTKPWSCIAEGKKGKGTTGTFINIESGKLDHCLDLLHQWHTVRSDLESLLKTETGDKDLDKGQKGRHKKEYFEGHCQKEGAGNYLPIGHLQKHNPKLPALDEFKTDDGATEQKR